MFNISPRTLLIAFLAFCVLSSKNIIIYNEETLVTLSFVLFVFFVFHYFGNTVKESLDERSEGIKTECQNFLHYKQQSLKELYAEHEKIGQLEAALSQLMQGTKSTITQLTERATFSLENTFSQQMIQKCGELRASQLPQNLQKLMAKNQQQLVLIQCEKDNLNGLSPSVLRNAIQLLRSATGVTKKK